MTPSSTVDKRHRYRLPVSSRWLPLVAVAVLALAAMACDALDELLADELDEGLWEVTWVIDGDTIDVRNADGVEERVRFIGIDTPERGECGYQEATDLLIDLIGDDPVRLIAGATNDRDAYDRILRYVEVDGVDTGHVLLEQGWAVARYDSRDGRGPHTREDDYIATDDATVHRCGEVSPAAR